ncbi:hypothetical protein RFI_21296 [Reticulomyxa filosa]|uniref:Uncharacterized protein n=1 Tax=Reticulomyxa filosa TaxID=46433 RepID=X6MSH8_RETFI|nr:hypothetical protein RFI_21296 [Reticulomyxa filosa]|eukprot:ETO16065.1 hypothetical protein RFI_21296 [Reticulomyxa filosa]
MPIPELIRADLSSCIWNEYFHPDAIMCDPPYGIRAGGRKSGTKKPLKSNSFPLLCFTAKPQHKCNLEGQNPRTQVYDAEECVGDLLQFAAKMLPIGGRLVYLLPTTDELSGKKKRIFVVCHDPYLCHSYVCIYNFIDRYKDEELPLHPALEVRGNSEQKCQGILRRRLITMVKVTPFTDDMKTQIPVRPAFANLKEKIFVKKPKNDIKQEKRKEELQRSCENDIKRRRKNDTDDPILE